MNNDSDDFFVKGEEAEQKALNEVKIWYVITSPYNPTEVRLQIKTKDGRDVITLITDTATTGINHFTWDGKYWKEWAPADGFFAFVEDWLFTTQIEAFFTDKPKEEKPVKSNLHQITELSKKHKPKIFLQEKEFCGPISFEHMDTQDPEGKEGGMYKKHDYVGGRGEPVLDLISTNDWNTEEYYLNFPEWVLKMPYHQIIFPAGCAVFSRGKVEGDLAFVQYWMWYPSSTGGTTNPKDEPVYHEGDWEMMQVVVKLDTENKVLTPTGSTASQHYRGETLSWAKIPQIANKNSPVIYIAGGSHATYFTTKKYFYIAVSADHTEDPKANPEKYTLKPFGPLLPAIGPEVMWWLWKGHWGEYDQTWDLTFRTFWGATFAPKTNSGPLGPKYRKTEDDIMVFDQPETFYETYKKHNPSEQNP